MARILQVGVGRNCSGTIDGITYYTRNGVTFARAAPKMPKRAYRTPAALKRQALFKFIQMHIKCHLGIIRRTFAPLGNVCPSNRYYSVNNKNLRKALDALADRDVAGEMVTTADVEAAICAYATENPASIRIASMPGYGEVFLTGDWPDTITLRTEDDGNPVTVIVSGTATTP
jgi:hypothetical protein